MMFNDVAIVSIALSYCLFCLKMFPVVSLAFMPFAYCAFVAVPSVTSGMNTPIAMVIVSAHLFGVYEIQSLGAGRTFNGAALLVFLYLVVGIEHYTAAASTLNLVSDDAWVALS